MLNVRTKLCEKINKKKEANRETRHKDEEQTIRTKVQVIESMSIEYNTKTDLN